MCADVLVVLLDEGPKIGEGEAAPDAMVELEGGGVSRRQPQS